MPSSNMHDQVELQFKFLFFVELRCKSCLVMSKSNLLVDIFIKVPIIFAMFQWRDIMLSCVFQLIIVQKFVVPRVRTLLSCSNSLTFSSFSWLFKFRCHFRKLSKSSLFFSDITRMYFILSLLRHLQ